jgi:8-oxo-dGTP diphosphatase
MDIEQQAQIFKAGHIVTSVVAVIVDDQDQVLLTKRNVPPFQGEWVMPGGKIDLGEPIVEALKREVYEEVGLEVEVGQLIDVFEHVTPGQDNYHFIIIYYLCTPVFCDISHNQHEVAEARWVPRDELMNYKIPAGAKFILGKIFPEVTES